MYSVSPSSIKDDEECLDLDEAIDRKSVAQERQREAVDDFADEDSEILDKPTMQEDPDDDESRTDDIKIPFSCLNSYQGNMTITRPLLWIISLEHASHALRLPYSLGCVYRVLYAFHLPEIISTVLR